MICIQAMNVSFRLNSCLLVNEIALKSMNNQRTQRTWTDNDAQGTSKWLPITVLSILLAIGLYVFFKSVWWEAAPRTYAFAIAITKYDGKLLPQPAYPTWQMSPEQFEQGGLSPWEFSETETPNSRDEISTTFNALDDELASKKVHARDTVIVYLRGHAIAHQDKAYLLAGEFDRPDLLNIDATRQDADSRAAIPLDDILSQLQALKAGNVILVADICDLRTAPKLGVIANNVSELIARSVAELSGKSVWVITANAALQPAHTSYTRERTLLQSACDYACNASMIKKGDKYLSLARFYEAILRYSSDVTDKKQTPLLFRSGTSGNLSDTDTRSWSAAEQVCVSLVKSNLPSPEELSPEQLEKLAPKVEKTAGDRQDSGVKFVAFTQEPGAGTAQGLNTQDKPAQGKGTESDSAEGVATPAEPLASTPALRFWQLHEELLKRNNLAGWSPVDFATGRWREMELEACELERVARFSKRSQIREDQQRLTFELEQLSNALQTGASNSAASNLKLLSAWNQLQVELTPAGGKLPWKVPDAIPQSEAARWQPIREGYRTYLDTMSQLPGWLSQGLSSEQANRNLTLQSLDELVKALRALDPKLPTEADASALEHPLDVGDLNFAQTSIRRLQQQLMRRADDILAKLRDAQSALLWSDEREIQELLMHTHLSFAKRAELSSAYDSLTVERIRQPGEKGMALNKNLEISELLADPGTNAALVHFAAWTDILQQTLQLTETPVASSPASDSPKQLNEWGYELIVKARDFQPSSNPAASWKQACLNDLDLFPHTGDASLLVAVSKDQSMDVVVPSALQLPKVLKCELKRRNGAPVERCYFKWELLNADAFTALGSDLLVAKSRSGQILEPGTEYPISVAGSVAEVELASALWLSSKREVIKIRVAIADQANAASTDWHAVDILPRNPDKIDIYAKYVNPAPNEPAILRSIQDEVSGEPVLRELAVPGVGQAKRAFELYLTNLSDQEKLVVASIYAVQSDRIVGDGRVTPQAMDQTRNNLPKLEKQFVSSGPIRLPVNGNSISAAGNNEPTNGKRIELVPAQASAPNAAPLTESVATFGEFGLVCALQEVSAGAEGQPPVPLNKPPTLHWIDCVAVNPARGLVAIEAPARERSFELAIDVPAEHWTRWDIKELKVSARLSDERGKDVPGSVRTSVLKPGEGPTILNLAPKEQSIEPYVAHLDIGGYPRSANFQSRLTGRISDVPRGATQSFVWLEQDRLMCMTPDAQRIPTQTLNEQVVVPAHENVDDKSDGTPVTAAKLVIPLQIDFPKNNMRSTAEVSLDGVAQKFSFDRQFLPRFSLSDGNLVFSATVDDLVFELPLQNYDPTGMKTLKAQTSDSTESSAKSFAVVFDQVPPRKSEIQIDSSKLYLEESIQLSIDSVDEDSEVRSVYFAFDQENFKEGVFDVKDEVHLTAKKIGGVWLATLKASDIENAYPSGDYWIVCRSVDFAGNVQDKNERKRFEWTGKKRPVSEPKKPVVKPKPQTPSPPVATTHTVLVEITVNGAKPHYPEKTGISGITGAAQNRSGSNWTVTKVPEGEYEIKATYSDAFGVAYEGTGKITVTASSGRRVTIDVKK
jgi:hypothetical protein